MTIQSEYVDAYKWQKFLEEMPDYNYSQLPKWAYNWEKSYPEYKVGTKLFTFPDKTKILIPLIEKSAKYGYKQLISLPYGTFGGILWDKKPSKLQIRYIIKNLLARNILSVEIYPNPLNWTEIQFLEDYGFQANLVFTHILYLNKEYEKIWKNVFKNRTQIRKALKEGINIIIGKDSSHIQAYYELYMSSVEKWKELKGGIIPFHFLNNLFCSDKENIRCYMAQYKGKYIAGAIILYGKKNCFYWTGGMLKEYSYCRPNNLLFNKIIEDACSEGYSYFDMGASVGLPGVEKFKESFGAKKVEYKYFTYKNPLFETYKKLKSYIK
jgi:hypothetical protein